MRTKQVKTPIIIIALGLVLAVAVHFLTSIQLKPIVTEQDFAYSVTYKIDGETKTFEGVYTCRFDGFGDNGIDPLTRYYAETYTVDGATDAGRQYTIAEKDGYALEIITTLNDCYLMGDTKNDAYSELEEPCFEAVDADGNQYGEEELPAVFDAEIVSWDYPAPVQNDFVFAGFSGLHTTGMLGMLFVGLLTLILCMFFVKKSDDVVYSALDKVGVVLNVVIAVGVLPIISLAACLIQAFPTGPDWIYQAFLCVPPILSFTLAASASLRRKGFRRSGFFVQFLGIALLAILCVLEYVL